MPEIRVNPTRMELKKLQTRHATARRGHKLLKDKRDELMRSLLLVVREAKEVRAQVETALSSAHDRFAAAAAVTHPKMLEAALILPKTEIALDGSLKNRMSVTVPSFEVHYQGEGDSANYGYAFTSGELDDAIDAFGEILPVMLKMAQLEKEAALLAEEIERTRRRVNALEHIMIPDYVKAIKTIKMKLEENERGNVTRLMKVKDMMLAAQLEKKHSFFPDEE